MWKRERVSQKFNDSREMLPGWLLKIMATVEPDHCLQCAEEPPVSYLCSIWELWAGISNKGKSYWVGLKLSWLQNRFNACLTQNILLILNTSHRAIPHTIPTPKNWKPTFLSREDIRGIVQSSVCRERRIKINGPLNSSMPENFWLGSQVLSSRTQGGSQLHEGR